jgi:hypothetical protein
MSHCVITFYDGEVFCSRMAERGYNRSSRARGLKQEANLVSRKACEVIDSIPREMTEGINDSPLEKLEVKLMSVSDNKIDICVPRKQED